MRLVMLGLLVMGCNGKDDGSSEGDDDDDTGDTDDIELAEEVTRGCIDGDYREDIADNTVDLTDLKADFDANDSRGWLIDALAERYPVGSYIVENAPSTCYTQFSTADSQSSADGTLGRASLLVHECGHYLDIETGSLGTTAAYVITEDLTLTCSGGYVTSTFARSEINNDKWASQNPGDFYQQVYLSGQSGAQGFDTVLEETTQYINSLGTAYGLSDTYVGSVSERDGILTFLWYTQRYLQWARTQHPTVYERLVNDPCWQDAILTLWGRAWLYLEASEDYPQLGISDDTLIELVREPELLDEIERVRAATGCVDPID